MLLNDVLVEIEEEEVDVSMEDVKIGTAGSDGKDGKDGATFYPSVSEDGILSWTNDQGLDNPKPVNIKGKDGVSPNTDLFSNALKGSKKGNAIVINDISPIEHTVNVNVSLKIEPTSFSVPNEVYQLFQDATDGESSEIAVYDGIKSGTMLKLVRTNKDSVYFLYTDESSSLFPINFDEDSYSFAAPSGYFAIAYDTYLNNIGVVSSKHSLYYDSKDLSVIKAGLNLFKPYVAEKTQAGITARLTEDGFVETSGTFSNSTVIQLDPPSGYIKYALPSGTYSTLKKYGGITANDITDVFFGVSYVDGSGNVNIDSRATVLSKPFYITRVYMQVKKDAGANIRFPAMLHLSSASNVEFEEYKEIQTYDVNDDGTVDGVTPYKPSTTFMTNIDGATIECTYNRDINKAFAELQNAIISIGGIL